VRTQRRSPLDTNLTKWLSKCEGSIEGNEKNTIIWWQWCNGADIEENKEKITNNLRDKHESIKRNGMKGAKKDKKRKRWRELMKKERCHAIWRREDSKMSGVKSHHLRCYPPKIRPKNESSQVSQNHSCRVSLLLNFNVSIHGGRHPLYRKEWLGGQDEWGVEKEGERGYLGCWPWSKLHLRHNF